MARKIVLTGGGTAGHVMPNLALLPLLRDHGWEVHYIGRETGIERELALEAGLPYHGINGGKLRRYFSMQNFTDPFRVIHGCAQALWHLSRLRPRVVFSKGGFVSVPVVVAAWLRRIPVVLHESDITPGLANRLSFPFATKVCATFPDTMKHLPRRKRELTGTPIRAELFTGSSANAAAHFGIDSTRPLILFMGGSSGSKIINHALRGALKQLLAEYQVFHICGKDGLEPALDALEGYCQYAFVGKELPDVLAASHMVVSRAGANSLFEILALQKPNLLIPLSRKASRGDQIKNADSFERLGYSRVLPEEELTPERLLRDVSKLYLDRENYRARMAGSPFNNGAERVCELLRGLGGG